MSEFVNVAVGIGFWVAVLGGSWLFFKATLPAAEIKMLLGCSKSEARMVLEYIRSIGMTFLRLHELVSRAQGRLMPMYVQPGSESFVATWGEVADATVRLAAGQKFDGSIKVDAFISMVLQDVLSFRRSNPEEEPAAPEFAAGYTFGPAGLQATRSGAVDQIQF